jgi:hypothetical protein
MFRRSFRLLSLLSLVALLGGIFPLGAAAQFPSQGQGGAPSPGGFPSSGGGRGGFYQGQVYGFALSWGPEWTLTQEAAEQGFEAITLTNGVSTITLGGFAMQGTPQDVVTQTATDLGGGQWTFNTIVWDEPTVAAAYFDTPSGQLAYFLYVEVTGPASGLFIIWEFPPAQWETEDLAYDALMAGLEYTVTS